jgi:hypothetical protein
MNYQDFMSTLRKWDKNSSQWFMRHFYLLFFEIILVIVFVLFFINTINVLNAGADLRSFSTLEQLVYNQNIVGLLILFLLLLNSFWMLFMFSGILRLRNLLRNIDFNLSRRGTDRRSDDN